jgi:hypothetical protein
MSINPDEETNQLYLDIFSRKTSPPFVIMLTSACVRLPGMSLT